MGEDRGGRSQLEAMLGLPGDPLSWFEVAVRLQRLRRGSKRALRAMVPAVLALSARERAALRSTWRDARGNAEKAPLYFGQCWESFLIKRSYAGLQLAAALKSIDEICIVQFMVRDESAMGRLGQNAANLILAACDRLEHAIGDTH